MFSVFLVHLSAGCPYPIDRKDATGKDQQGRPDMREGEPSPGKNVSSPSRQDEYRWVGGGHRWYAMEC